MNNVIETLIGEEINNFYSVSEKIEYIEKLITELENIVSRMRYSPWDYE